MVTKAQVCLTPNSRPLNNMLNFLKRNKAHRFKDVAKIQWRTLPLKDGFMFQCHSPKSSHPLPLPQSPKDCSIHLCLFWHWNMYNIIYETDRQSRFNAWYWMLGAGALRRPRGMVQGRRFRMRNTCTPMADSCWCMAKPVQYCKVISLQLK